MNIKDYIRSIPDYPKKGILFRDITTLIKNENAFSQCIDDIVIKSKKFVTKRGITEYLNWGVRISLTPYRNRLRNDKNIRLTQNGYEYIGD